MLGTDTIFLSTVMYLNYNCHFFGDFIFWLNQILHMKMKMFLSLAIHIQICVLI